jgi:hypothetical protein
MRIPSALLALACSLAVAACGDDDSVSPPKGAPAARHGAQSIDTLFAVENVRSRMLAASNLYGIRSDRDSLGQVRAAHEAYLALSERVRRRDQALAHEFDVAFQDAERGVARGAAIEPVRTRMAQIGGQLSKGASEALTSPDTTADLGVQAELLVRTLDALGREYERGARAGSAGPDRLAFEHASALLSRAQVIARVIAPALGSRTKDVLDGLNAVRLAAFPLGVARPAAPAPAARVRPQVQRARRIVVRRFALG